MNAESAGVTETIQDRAVDQITRHYSPIGALIEKEPSFLPFANIGAKPNLAFCNLNWFTGYVPPQKSILKFEPFKFADAPFCANIEADGTREFGKQLGQHVFALANSK